MVAAQLQERMRVRMPEAHSTHLMTTLSPTLMWRRLSEPQSKWMRDPRSKPTGRDGKDIRWS